MIMSDLSLCRSSRVESLCGIRDGLLGRLIVSGVELDFVHWLGFGLEFVLGGFGV